MHPYIPILSLMPLQLLEIISFPLSPLDFTPTHPFASNHIFTPGQHWRVGGSKARRATRSKGRLEGIETPRRRAIQVSEVLLDDLCDVIGQGEVQRLDLLLVAAVSDEVPLLEDGTVPMCFLILVHIVVQTKQSPVVIFQTTVALTK